MFFPKTFYQSPDRKIFSGSSISTPLVYKHTIQIRCPIFSATSLGWSFLGCRRNYSKLYNVYRHNLRHNRCRAFKHSISNDELFLTTSMSKFISMILRYTTCHLRMYTVKGKRKWELQFRKHGLKNHPDIQLVRYQIEHRYLNCLIVCLA